MYHARLPIKVSPLAVSNVFLTHGLMGCRGLQNKGRVDKELIKPAVDWRKTGTKSATMSAFSRT